MKSKCQPAHALAALLALAAAVQAPAMDDLNTPADPSGSVPAAATVAVTFAPQGGSLAAHSAARSATPGEPYGALPVPARAGFVFAGWWTLPDGTGALVTSSAIVSAPAAGAGAAAGALTLYAKWTPAATEREASCSPAQEQDAPATFAAAPELVFQPDTVIRFVPGMLSGSLSLTVSNIGGGTQAWQAGILEKSGAPCTWARVVSGATGVNHGTLIATYDANPAGGYYREAVAVLSATNTANGTTQMYYSGIFQAANRSGGGNGPIPDLIHLPAGLVRDPADGALYTISAAGDTIHKIIPAGDTGAVITLAGKTGASGTTNATGAAARFDTPSAITLAAGGLFVVDGFKVASRRVDLATCAVTTLPGVGDMELDTFLDYPNCVAASPAGDTIYALVRGRDGMGRAFGIVCEFPLAGSGTATTNGAAITLAGQYGVSGTANGIGAAASFKNLSGITVAANGDIYVGEEREDGVTSTAVVRKITPAGVVTTLAGGVPGVPASLAVDNTRQRLYLAADNAIYRRALNGGDTFTLAAGNPAYGGEDCNHDGPAAEARFESGIAGLAVDEATGDLYIADTFNNTIRKLSTSGTVTTLLLTATTATTGTGDGNGGGNNPGGGGGNSGSSSSGGGGGAPLLPALALLALAFAARARPRH
ncbi:MAG: InlB B-repeat-containing protein [Opitutaceae bacterium]|nr:InlB B-repeat-containing protein [Opitutaceae bacterium]